MTASNKRDRYTSGAHTLRGKFCTVMQITVELIRLAELIRFLVSLVN